MILEFVFFFLLQGNDDQLVLFGGKKLKRMFRVLEFLTQVVGRNSETAVYYFSLLCYYVYSFFLSLVLFISPFLDFSVCWRFQTLRNTYFLSYSLSLSSISLSFFFICSSFSLSLLVNVQLFNFFHCLLLFSFSFNLFIFSLPLRFSLPCFASLSSCALSLHFSLIFYLLPPSLPLLRNPITASFSLSLPSPVYLPLYC